MVLPFFTLEKNAPYCVNSIVKRVRKVNELNRQNPVSRGLAPFFCFSVLFCHFDPLMETSQPGRTFSSGYSAVCRFACRVFGKIESIFCKTGLLRKSMGMRMNEHGPLENEITRVISATVRRSPALMLDGSVSKKCRCLFRFWTLSVQEKLGPYPADG